MTSRLYQRRTREEPHSDYEYSTTPRLSYCEGAHTVCLTEVDLAIFDHRDGPPAQVEVLRSQVMCYFVHQGRSSFKRQTATHQCNFLVLSEVEDTCLSLGSSEIFLLAGIRSRTSTYIGTGRLA